MIAALGMRQSATRSRTIVSSLTAADTILPGTGVFKPEFRVDPFTSS